MSLFKQIAMIFSIFIILIISSIMYLNFKSSSDFIQNQLYTISEDTATSLGLSLSMNIPSDDGDLSTMETMINAIFDRGYYESIILKDMDGKTLIENKNIIKVKNIPDWFIQNVHIKVPTAQTQISNGWIPYGSLHVKLHSGHAYQQLWQIFIEILNTFTFLSAIAILALHLLLKVILQSLKKIQKQAIAITKNNFIIQEKMPYTTEFKHVVIGMNKMVKKVKQIFEHEAAIVQKYNDLLYKDQDSGMGNRKFFSLRLSSLIEQQDIKSCGTIIIFVLHNFTQVKQEVGFKILNDYINALADLFYASTQNIEERVVSRLKDDEFSMILPNTNYILAKEITTKFIQDAEAIKSAEIKKIKDFYISGGATYYSEEDKQHEILSRADYALSNAKMKNKNDVYFHDIQSNNSLEELGKQEWHKLIDHALNFDGIKLSLQPVLDTLHNTFHEEAYLRIADEKGTIHPARVFLPMLNSLELSDVVDRKVIENAISLVKKGTYKSIAINTTASFIQKLENIRWLEHILKRNHSHNISFEASNYAVTHNLELFRGFVYILEKYGYKLGIDNFRISSQNLSYLQALKPSYIKANKSFFLDIYGENQNSLYESFKILTSSLDIKLIATSVETQEEAEKLKDINIELMQGRFIQEPSL